METIFFNLFLITRDDQYIQLTTTDNKERFDGFISNAPIKFCNRKVERIYCREHEDILVVILEAMEDGKDERMDKTSQADTGNETLES
jgi:hypothetical protein